MKRQDLLLEMKKCIGTQDPVVFFEKMTEVFGLLFDRIDQLQLDLNRVKTHSALAVQWEPRVASDMLARQINVLRQDKDIYFDEIELLKKAFAEDLVTQDYKRFCNFWTEALGWHPFLDYEK
jgi:hypothetical protein